MSNKVADLERAPKSRFLHLWADYIEMLTMQNPDKEMGKADIIDRILERQDLGEAKDIPDEIGPSADKEDDRNGLFIEDCFRILAYRTGAFGDAYPFRLTEDRKVLQFKTVVNPLYSMYVFLLLAANLGYVDQRFYGNITATFEFISLEALKCYLPPNVRVIHFGKNPYNNDERYSGKLSQKIHHLAEDLHLKPHQDVDSIDSQNVGDDGLDLVAYIPFSDNADGLLHIFCQCACSDEWVSKQLQCSEANWGNKLKFTALLPYMVFIPFCFRKATGNWYDPLKIYRSILVDRVRLMSLIGNNPSVLAKFLDLPAVNEFLAEEESIF
jgi:hypothetical protein